MTLLSKLLVQRALTTNIVRKFRWDAKPDNIHSHSFRQVVLPLAMTSRLQTILHSTDHRITPLGLESVCPLHILDPFWWTGLILPQLCSL